MSRSKRWLILLAAALALNAGAGSAAAQAPQATDAPMPGPQSTDAPKNVPDLALSAEQKHTIYQALAGPQAKNNPEPVGFRVAPGAHVPAAIKLEPVPRLVVDLIPRMAGYQYALVARQVIVVEPGSNTVVEVIVQ